MINRAQGESNDQLQHIRNEIVEAYQKDGESSELGNLALEVLMLRTELEEKDDSESKKALEELRELEKSLISIYMMGRLKTSKRPFSKDFLYPMFQK